MARTTRATKALGRAGVAHRVATYDYDPAADRIGLAAAQALGAEPGRVLKTLMAKHLKALQWRTPYQAICDARTKDRSISKIDPHQLIPGPHT